MTFLNPLSPLRRKVVQTLGSTLLFPSVPLLHFFFLDDNRHYCFLYLYMMFILKFHELKLRIELKRERPEKFTPQRGFETPSECIKTQIERPDRSADLSEAFPKIKTDSVQSSSNYLQKLFTKNLLTAR